MASRSESAVVAGAGAVGPAAASANQPVRHHYLPRFYLSAWCSPGAPGEGDRVYVVQNFDGAITFSRKAPKATGFADHLYSFTKSLPTPEPAALETKFFSQLDSKGAELIAKLKGGVRLNKEERGFWATFIAAMRARTPENVALVKDIGSSHVKLELGKGQGEYEKLKESGDPETIVEWIESQFPGLVENFSLASIPRVVSGKVVLKIDKMAWHCLDFSAGKHRLLASDRPCVFTTGIDDPDCVVALPLSSQHAFLAFYPDSKAQATLTRHGPTVIAAALNKNVVTQAKDRAYCFSKGDAPEGFYQHYLVKKPSGRRAASGTS